MDSISFGTDGWRAPRTAVTPERLHTVGGAIATVLADRGAGGAELVVGYDARKGAKTSAQELARALAAAGHDIRFATRDCPTPAVVTAIRQDELAGGVMVTASHNPPEDLGVKFIPQTGQPAPTELTNAIEAALETTPPERSTGTITRQDLIEPYVMTVLDRAAVDLSGLTIGYDAIHGSGRGVTDQALERAGAAVTRYRCQRDPTFGGGPPNPTADRLTELTAAVDDGTIDLGLATDGDADRVAIITERGVLSANQLFAILYADLLKTQTGGVVRTVSTTTLLDRIADANDEPVFETPVGFKHVAERMTDSNALMGGEESGGFTTRGHIPNKDGTFIGLLAAGAAHERSLVDRLTALEDRYGPYQTDRRSIGCPEQQKESVMAALREAPPATVAGTAVVSSTELDGLKISLADGSWLLVRPSGTEPKLRIYAEAGDSDRVETLLTAGEQLVDDQLSAS